MNNEWSRPNEFAMMLRCTTSEYAHSFIERGQMKFSTPQSWVDYERFNSKGRGDLLEGTMAYCYYERLDNNQVLLDIDKINEFGSKYNTDAYFAQHIENRLVIKRKRNMQLPCFCFYMLKQGMFSPPDAPGIQSIKTTIPKEYFRDFADQWTPEQFKRKPEAERPAVAALKDFSEFRSRVNQKLIELGVPEHSIIWGMVDYFDFDTHGKEGWQEFDCTSPNELFIKSHVFELQNEGRVIIDTHDEDLLEKLRTPIEIGSLRDIGALIDGYMYEGIGVEMTADIYEAE